MTAALTLDGLVHRFPGSSTPVLDHVDLEVPVGDCVALLGPSGSGKSTLLRCAAGLDTPAGGRVLMDGRDVTRLAPERRGVSLVSQRPLLFPHLAVRDNVAFAARVRGASRREARAGADRYLDLVQLRHLGRRHINALSGGQQQRVALARALAAGPDVLLLDEPFTAMDPELRLEMHDLLEELRAVLEPTVVLVTHDHDEASAVADSIAVIVDGRLVQHGAVDEVYARPAGETVHRLLGGRHAVRGVTCGHVHRSSLGELALPADSTCPDGPSLLLVRHEALRLVAADDPAATTRGRVVGTRRRGAKRVLEVSLGAEVLIVEVQPGGTSAVGDHAGVVVPATAVWAVPDVRDGADDRSDLITARPQHGED